MWTLPDATSPQAHSIAGATARLNIWHGPVRCGKTVAANLTWLRRIGHAALSGQPGDFLMWGKTERTLKRNVLDPIGEFLGPSRYSYNRGDGEAAIFGRRVHIAGANDERAVGKIQGGTYLGAYGDELALTPDSFRSMALSRLSLPGAFLVGTTNPDGPYHTLKTDFLDRAEKLDLAAFSWPIEANPHLPRDYIANLKAEYGGPGTLWYKRFILGLWVQAAGAVYEQWSEGHHVSAAPPRETEPTARAVGVDYGTSNATAFVQVDGWAAEDARPLFHVPRAESYDGRAAGQRTDEQHADALAAFLAPLPAGTPVYVDPSAASFIAVLRNRGVYVRDADNAVLDGIRYVSAALGSPEATPSVPARLTVHPDCTDLRREFAAYVWDER
ncbi:MAG: terminase family protein, partial [Bacteroidota bacterium]